jgi:hypothetical protein
MVQPVADFRLRFPAVWSAWEWVQRMRSSFQPSSRRRRAIAAPSGASTEAVKPVASSRTRTAKLSVRQMNWSTMSGMRAFPKAPLVSSGRRCLKPPTLGAGLYLRQIAIVRIGVR